MSAAIHRDEVESFLYREARLLDTRRFEDWLALFTDDALYWVPAGHEDIDPTRHVSIMHDTKEALARRITRLRSGHAYAQEPPSRTHRIVSNVELVPSRTPDLALTASCMMLLVVLSRRRQTVYSAHCEFDLRGARDEWRIARKKVNLLRAGEVLEGIPYLL